MEEENLSLNEGQENVVDSQTEEVNTQEQGEQNNVSEEVVTPQSPEQNHAFAELRRQAEQTQRELQQRDEWVQKTFSSFGITNWQEYQERMEQQLQEQREEELKSQGYDPNAIREIMKNDPEIKGIIEKNQQLEQQLETEKQNQRLVSEFTQLQSQFPEVKTPEDIPTEVWQKVDKGYSLEDAYFLANKDKFMQKTEKETIQKLQSNSNKAIGALGTEGSDNQTSIKNMPKKDFDDMLNKVLRGEKIEI